MLFQSQWEIILKILMTVLIGVQVVIIYRAPVPDRRYAALEYNGRAWFLHHASGEVDDFLEGRMVMSCGLFFLFKLKNGVQSKLLIIFVDQISNRFARFLRLSQQCHINRWWF